MSMKLQLVHAFGSSSDRKCREALSMSERDNKEPMIVFAAGKSLVYVFRRPVVYGVNEVENVDRLQFMVVLPTRTHVAIAFKPVNSAQSVIRIHSFKAEEKPATIKTFSETDKPGIIRMMAFSPSEPKFMCTLLGQPHNRLIYVDCSKDKALAESSFACRDIDKISVSPSNSHLICASGDNVVKMFKVEEYIFKPLEEIKKLPKSRIFTDHKWYQGKCLLLATDKCEILLVAETKPYVYQVKQEYLNVFNESIGDMTFPTVICPFSKGFILGSNNGKFALWTKTEEADGGNFLELVRKWATTEDRAAPVVAIDITVKEDVLALWFGNHDIATLYLNEIIPQSADLLNSIAQKEIVFEYIYKGFHNEAITGMDICQQRPLIATCSRQDSTIRVWDYKNYGCKLLRMFYFKVKDNAQSGKPLVTLALHPSGYYLAVSCIDKLRMFHVLNAELRPYRQLPVKQAHLLRFGKGGHMLVVCCPTDDNPTIDTIKVFHSLTLELLANLSEHSHIRTIAFKESDTHLLCVTAAGRVSEWKTQDWVKTKSIGNTKVTYACGMYSSRNTIVVYGNLEGKDVLDEYNCDGAQLTQSFIGMEIVAMAEARVGKQYGMLLSLANGTMLCYGGGQRQTIMDVHSEHIGRTEHMVISPCRRYVVTSGEDCLILLYKFKGDLQEEEISNSSVDDFLADVVLIHKRQIEEAETREREHTNTIVVLGKKLKQCRQDMQRKHQLRLAQEELEKDKIIYELRQRIDRMQEQKNALVRKNEEALEELDKVNLRKAEELQRSYTEKLDFEAEKYFQFQQQLIQDKVVHQRSMQLIKQEEETRIERLKKEFEGKFRQSSHIYSSAKKQTLQSTGMFDHRVRLLEEEQEEEVGEIQAKKQGFKVEAAAALKELAEKQLKLKKEYSRLAHQKEEELNRNKERTYLFKKAEKQVGEAKELLEAMGMEFREKGELLKTKEKRIEEFEEKISDLLKKKHILSYKGTEMKKAIEPKEVQIDKLKIDLVRLKKEFESTLERKQKAILTMEKCEKERNLLEKALREQTGETEKHSERLDDIISSIYSSLEGLKENSDSKVYYKELVKIYHKYVENDKVEGEGRGVGVDQLSKQIVHLEKSLHQLNIADEKNLLRKNQEINKKIKENAELVNNVNEVKKENKELTLKIKFKKDEIEHMKNQKRDLLAECRNLSTNPTAFKLLLKDEEPDRPDKSVGTSGTFQLSRQSNKLLPLVGDNKRDTRRDHQKIECELISEIQFTNEKIGKLDFYLRDTKEKITKHIKQWKCQGEFTVEEERPHRYSPATEQK